ncbi:serum amyloid A [Acanthochromis polyacanthus]|uniref:serum amyloid A n=1 Tax=Acanthochromis polyacanthus TaxID=80966 RepID=UPI0022340D4A|nr:serum amyloid A [Acanthochromis polyacanthus]
MKLLLAGLVLLLIVEINAQLYNFPAEATQGELDMANAYDDREDANWKGSNTYNHQVAVKGAGLWTDYGHIRQPKSGHRG